MTHTTTNTLTCPSCSTSFQPAPPRGGKPQTWCSRPCQIKAANERRSIKRRSSRPNLSKGAQPQPAALPQEALSTPTLLTMPPSVDRLVSEPQHTPAERIAELLAKGHSREGISAWDLATLAKLRGISPWAPVRVILAKEGPK